jgi:hypothetical protein
MAAITVMLAALRNMQVRGGATAAALPAVHTVRGCCSMAPVVVMVPALHNMRVRGSAMAATLPASRTM